MSAELHRLTPVGPVTKPDADLIKRLGELLKMAKRGEIKGFGFFFVEANDTLSRGYVSGCADRHAMVCASTFSHRQIVDAAYGD